MQHRAALEQAYREHGHSVLRRARQLLGNEEEARDVLHEIFTSLVARPAQFEGGSRWTTWLYSATTHACLNRLRNHKTRLRILEASLAPAASERVEARAEDLATARQLLGRMPQELALVLAYAFFDEMTHDEIAELLGCSRRHVGDLIARGQAWATSQERSA